MKSTFPEFAVGYSQAWGKRDPDAIVAMHTDDTVFTMHGYAAGREHPGVGEIEILRDKQAPVGLSGNPDLAVRLPREPLGRDRVDVKAQRSQAWCRGRWDVLVQFDLHATFTSGGMGLGAGRSSATDAAANAMTARTSSAVTVGNSFTICSTVSPWARCARMTRRGTRVPRTTGWPPQTCGSRAM